MDDITSGRQRLDSTQGDTAFGVHLPLRTAPFNRLAPILNEANSALQQLLEAAFDAGRMTGISEGQNVMRAKLAALLDLDYERHTAPERSLPSAEHDRSLQNDSIIAPAENERNVQWTTRLPS